MAFSKMVGLDVRPVTPSSTSRSSSPFTSMSRLM